MGSQAANPYFGGGAGYTLVNTSRPGQPFKVGDNWLFTVMGPPNLVVQTSWPIGPYNPNGGMTNAQGIFIATGTMQTAGQFQVDTSVAGGQAGPLQVYTVSPLAANETPASPPAPLPLSVGSARATECPPPIVDGFTHSISTLLLPTTYRALTLAQWEILRRSSNYQWRVWSGPSTQQNPVPSLSQVEYQVTMREGTYIWGWYLSLLPIGSGNIIDPKKVFVQVVDMECGLPILSDYQTASVMYNSSMGGRPFSRYPYLMPQPYLVANNGQVLFEVYNSLSFAVQVQLALYCAQPKLMPDACGNTPVACEAY
jgi:hypothetical protein